MTKRELTEKEVGEVVTTVLEMAIKVIGILMKGE